MTRCLLGHNYGIEFSSLGGQLFKILPTFSSFLFYFFGDLQSYVSNITKFLRTQNVGMCVEMLPESPCYACASALWIFSEPFQFPTLAAKQTPVSFFSSQSHFFWSSVHLYSILILHSDFKVCNYLPESITLAKLQSLVRRDFPEDETLAY